jgi:glycosyltransferase involved in cell wall biosynthesis
LPSKSAYLPNQFWAHKDHLTAFKALAQLRQRGVDLPLVCTGLEEDRRNPEHFAQLMRYLSENGIDGAVRCLGLVPRNDQIEIFRHASVVIQPSLFEGWSTVVEDTKTVGRPIIATDLSVHREQLKGYDRAWHFRPSAAEELAALLERVWPELPPGPDVERERVAARDTERRRQDAARRFISIARLAKALHEEGRSDHVCAALRLPATSTENGRSGRQRGPIIRLGSGE